MKEREALPKEPSMAEKVECQDSGHPSKRRSSAILERRVSRSYLGFSQSFIFTRPTGLRMEQVSVSLSQTFGEEKAGRATVTLRGLANDPASSD
jgi:hypothetical protein